ncbi:hypothetical protein [Fulvivirga ligni]|uniref:hypothetical protein n=1 Tax=Fulvivirga ligni TaxID=2904246 RepID=UPI001F3E8A91|nr:hypothetical protein [Fulvivirga ligni]UII19083.1 hypothetical protein LVD16_14660 [Fulvivirga ligni]
MRSIDENGAGKADHDHVRDVSLSANGTQWAVFIEPTTTAEAAGDGGVIKYKKAKSKKWEVFEGVGGVKIDGGPSGSTAYVINNKGEIYQLDVGKDPKMLAGQGFAREISAGADGTVWVITNSPTHGGGEVHYLKGSEQWQKVPGEMGGMKISGKPDGSALIINNDGVLGMITTDGSYEQLTGQGFAREISVAPDGSTWIISNEPADDGGNIVSYQSSEGGAWKDVEGGAIILDAGFA